MASQSYPPDDSFGTAYTSFEATLQLESWGRNLD